MRSRQLAAALLALAVVLAGCSTLPFGSGITEPDSNRADPASDTLGWEDGYWWNDSVAVDPADGLGRAEVEVVVARMMARIERIRGHEFTQSVDVAVISRREYRTRRSATNGSVRAEQLWEATFLVGEDTAVTESFDALYGSAVQGYYSNGRIVLVSDGSGDDLRISRSTLVHELEHALQDQQLSVAATAATRDGTLASRSVVEGDANYVEYRYEQRCANETFECVDVPAPTGSQDDRSSYNRGLFASTYLPYAAGSTFVASTYERGGWAAVDAAFEDRPTSTEQVIHPGAYPAERPTPVRIEDSSTDEWSPAGPPQRVGEGTAYAMFWYNGQIPEGHYRSGDDPVSSFTYDHPSTAGWGGDALLAYANDGERGYVWKTTWDSPADAREFHDAYLSLLASEDAVEVRTGTYVIENGAFADAFRVTRHGDTVVVVNAPTVDALDDVQDDTTIARQNATIPGSTGARIDRADVGRVGAIGDGVVVGRLGV